MRAMIGALVMVCGCDEASTLKETVSEGGFTALGEVGPEGGEVCLSEDACLTIPAGALDETVTFLGRIAADEDPEMIGPIYEFRSSIEVFNDLIDLTLPIPVGHENAHLDVAFETAEGWVPVYSEETLTDRLLTGQTTHLSTWSLQENPRTNLNFQNDTAEDVAVYLMHEIGAPGDLSVYRTLVLPPGTLDSTLMVSDFYLAVNTTDPTVSEIIPQPMLPTDSGAAYTWSSDGNLIQTEDTNRNEIALFNASAKTVYVTLLRGHDIAYTAAVDPQLTEVLSFHPHLFGGVSLASDAAFDQSTLTRLNYVEGTSSIFTVQTEAGQLVLTKD